MRITFTIMIALLGTLLGAQSSSVFSSPMEGAVNTISGLEYYEEELYVIGAYRVFIDSSENTVTNVPVLWNRDSSLDQVVRYPDRFSSSSYAYNKGFAVSKDLIVSHHEVIRDTLQRAVVEVLNDQAEQLDSFSFRMSEALGVWGIEVFDSTIYLASERGVGTDTSRGVLEARSFSGDLLWTTPFNNGKNQNKIRYIKDYSDTTIIIQLFEQDGVAGTEVMQRHFLKTIDKRTGEIVLDVDVTSYLATNLAPAPFTFAGNGDLIWFQRSNNIHTPVSQGNVVRLTFPELELVWEAILPMDIVANNRRYNAFDMQVASNGDVLVCGEVGQCPSRVGSEFGEACVVRAFASRYSTDGELVWHRVYSVPNEFLPIDEYRRYVDSYLVNIHERSDGSIITGGTAHYRNDAAFANHPDSTDSWYMILELDGETGCLAGEECVENIVLDGQVIDTTGLIFPIGTQWTYDYRELESLRVVHSTVTFEVVDTLDFAGRAASQVVSTLGDTIYLSEEGMSVYVYDDLLDDYVLTFDFDAINRYGDSISYFRRFEQDFAQTGVRVDSLGVTFTGDDRGFEMTQFVEYDYFSASPFLDGDTLTYSTTIVELMGRLNGGGVVRSPFHWPDAPATIDDGIFPAYGALRCFSTKGAEIDFLPIWPEEPCDTTYFEYNYPWSLEQVDPDRTWYVLQDEPGSDRLVTNSYGLSRDTFLLDGQYYHLVLRSDREDQAPATPAGYYMREEGGAVYRYEDGREQLIYDYDHRPGDVIDIDDASSEVDQLVCIGVDSFFYSKTLTMHRRLYYARLENGQPSADTCMTVLSGVGSLEGIEFGNPIVCGSQDLQLNCMLGGSRVHYHYERFGDLDDCWIIRTDTDEIGGTDTGITIYPNPASDEAIVYLGKATGKRHHIQLLDVTGQVVYVGPSSSETLITIPRGGLVDGLYIGHVIDEDDHIQTFKVVFQ